MEANGSESGQDFRHKIAICRKEARETKHWLRMIEKANAGCTDKCQKLFNEADELVKIFSKIIISYDANQKKSKTKRF